MKNTRKKLIVFLMTALMLMSVTIPASAAYVTFGSSCDTAVSSGSAGTDCISDSTACSGSDIQTILNCLGSGSCTTQTACNSAGTQSACNTGDTQAAAAETQTTCTTGTLPSFLESLLTKCGVETDGTDTDTDTAATPTPAATAAPSDTEDETAATPTPSATPTDTDDDAQATVDNLSFEEQVAALVNEQRAANGLSALTLSTTLSDVARLKSQDMHDNGYFSHTSPTYGSPFDMLKSLGISYRTAGENIAMGYASPEAVMDAWMNSAGHRANILNASYTQIGVGYVADGNYWTQEFIG